jgi:hypothetical protein
MVPSPRSSPVVQIFAPREGRAIGSGVLLAPRWVLSCGHVAENSEREYVRPWRRSGHDAALPKGIAVRARANDHAEWGVKRVVVSAGPLDLALIELEAEQLAAPVRMVAGVTAESHSRIDRAIAIHGSLDSPPILREVLVDKPDSFSPDFEDGLLHGITLRATIEKGMSGGAVLLHEVTPFTLIGIVDLGGPMIHAAHAISSDAVLVWIERVAPELAVTLDRVPLPPRPEHGQPGPSTRTVSNQISFNAPNYGPMHFGSGDIRS